MHRVAALALASLPAALAPDLAAQGADRDRTDRFVVPDGTAVTLWSESPQLYNPTAIDVDSKGRVWVTEGVNYRKWNGRNPGRDHPDGDRVVVLEDTDGDGAADTSRVFVQDEELVSPLGIAVVQEPRLDGDGPMPVHVFVSCSPKLIVYTDRDDDGTPDAKRVFLDGFGGRDHDHGLHSLVVGPDGDYWIAVGNAGPHVVTDGDGWTLRSGSYYRGGGAKAADNQPGLRSDDGRVWTGGLVLRVRPDGSHLRPLAHNFRNNYEVAVDAFGDMWQSDNDDDGNRSCRTLWCMPGGNHGYFSADGARGWRTDRRPGQATERAHWHQDDPGVVPAGAINGGGGPTGVCWYDRGQLPASFDGAILNADAGRSLVYAHRPRANGGGFNLEPEVLIRPNGDGDKARWFRPSDVAVAPDGSILVADWWDPGVGGHGARDREAYGKILRIAAPGAGGLGALPQRIESIATANRYAHNPAVHVRAVGAAWLVAAAANDTGVGHAVLAAVRSEPRAVDRARMVWVAARAGEFGAVQSALTGGSESDSGVRVTAFRALARFAPDQLAKLRTPELTLTADAALRREIALSLRGTRLDTDPSARATLDALVASYTPGDRSLLEAIGLATEGFEEALFAGAVSHHGAAPRAWPRALAELAWRLHPPSSITAHAARAMSPELSRDDRELAIAGLAFEPSRRAAEAMLAIAEGGPDDTRALAWWWTTHRARNLWREHGLAGEAGGNPDDAEVLWESATMHGASTALDIDVDVTGVDQLWLVVDDAGDGFSHDWATWGEPSLTNADGQTRRLGDLRWVRATTGWGETRVNRNCGGGELAVGGRTFAHGIGTHAKSSILFRLPADSTRLRATVGPDDGGTTQNGSRTSIRFRVLGTRAGAAGRGDATPMAAERALVTDATQTAAARTRAATALAADPDGGAFLVALAADDRLDAELRQAVAPTLLRNPSSAVRTLATRHFPRPGARPDLPSIPELAATVAADGDRRRGRALFFGKAGCAACHIHGGEGTDLGPDLSRIGDKLDATGLLDAILNPNASIPFGYEAWTVETTAGRLHYGFLLADGANLVLKDLGGARHVIAADDIASRKKQELSLMPEAIALGLAADELRDLTAFLAATPDDDPELGEPIRLLGDGSFDGWTHHLRNGSAARDDVWAFDADGVLVCKGRPAGYLRTEATYTNFELTLEWGFRGKPGNSGVLLRVHGPDKVWPKSIEAQLMHRNAGDIWNIDRFPMQVDTQRTEGRRTRKQAPCNEVPIGGWNRYRILLNRGELRLWVNGVLQNSASFCEERPGHIALQSEGAQILFRNVVLRPVVD